MDAAEHSSSKDNSERNSELADAVRPLFISYASQDAAVADKICTALEAAGLNCWIAPRDVRAGEPYAAAIVEAINACRMLVLVLTKSAIDSPHVLREVERASSKKRSVLSIRLDTAPLPPELEYFLSANQWLDASNGKIASVLPALIESVRDRGAGSIGPAPTAARQAEISRSGGVSGGRRRPYRSLAAIGILTAAALGYVLVARFWPSNIFTPVATDSAAPSPQNTLGASSTKPDSAASGPPPHSIAVLPFVNMSGDPKQDYFSDGLSEELLNSLAAIHELQVAARTSSFTFKGKNEDVADIARKLNVGAVLEGSVRKDGNQVRITAQLINASTGFHLWSRTYDRDLKNVLALQTEIATAVTRSLQATLLTDVATTIEIGGTQNPAAFDAYLRGKNLARGTFDKESLLARAAAFSEAIRLDPKFAKAYVEAANSQNSFANNFSPGDQIHSWFKQARANAEKAVALAPELGEAHASMAGIWERGYLDFARAQAEYDRALALSPNDTEVLLRSGFFLVQMGRIETGLGNIRRAISLDQLNPSAYSRLSLSLTDAHRYREANDAAERALQFNPGNTTLVNSRGFNYLMLGDLEAARAPCTTAKPSWIGRLCAAVLYDRIHQRAQAEAELAAMQGEFGDGASYQYAEIYTQWGNIPKALDWLETAYRVPDPGLLTLKSDPLVDPLRKEPRFKAIEQKLNFPN
jgi:serine/threonine-protein kinase